MALEEMLDDLDSLGISVKRDRKDLDTKEVADFIEILKMSLWKDYKKVYSIEE